MGDLDFDKEDHVPFEEEKPKKKRGKPTHIQSLQKSTDGDAEKEALRVAAQRLARLTVESKEGTHARDRKAITIPTTRAQHEVLSERARKAGTTLTKLVMMALEPYMGELPVQEMKSDEVE